ncbi:MAG: FprA family A-type flavoprotein [Candidatus Zixiibacteriota bacterium]|nr:MAG: FprA family A-type flavoprotein [candidate division Zixibacteria bacterium]
MSTVKLAEGVYSIGVKDPDLRIFDIIMTTQYGTTYNAYLIQGASATAVIDTVKKPFTEEFLANIEEMTSPDRIDYLIVNHNEPDHSGAITALLERNPALKIYCSSAAVPYLKNIINREADITGVKDKHTLELGCKTLTFRLMPYMHWPDTTMEFLEEDNILFSNDGFAAHVASESVFADEVTEDLQFEYRHYFDAIMRPFTGYMRRNLPKLDEHDIRMIAPSHGPVFRRDAAAYISRYKEWSADKSDSRNLITIFYATAYGNTKLIAERLADNLKKAGYEVDLTDVATAEVADLKDLIESSKAVLIGTPTFNGDAVRPVWDFVNLFSTVYSIGKKAAVFGSYGWGGEACKLVADRLSGLKLKVFEEHFRARLIPSEDEIRAIDEYSRKLVDFVGK